ncbi:hypothetical protein B188_16150 [Candidatus Brocadiaceae bacterium B188]|nr:hypothetical protein B188_16150 [Candidatus Brocadiaceae bacterium B188]
MTATPETFVPTFFVSCAKPFIQSSTAPLYRQKYLIESALFPYITKLLDTFFASFLPLHCLILQNVFGESLDVVDLSLRYYDINPLISHGTVNFIILPFWV